MNNRFITFLGILLFIKHCQLKLLSDLVKYSIFSSNFKLLDFQKKIRVFPIKYLMYFLAGISTK